MAIFNWNLVYLNDNDQQVGVRNFIDYFTAKQFAEQEENITPVALYNPTLMNQEIVRLMMIEAQSVPKPDVVLTQ